MNNAIFLACKINELMSLILAIPPGIAHKLPKNAVFQQPVKEVSSNSVPKI